MILYALLAGLLALPVLQDAHHADCSVPAGGTLLDARFVDTDDDGREELVLAAAFVIAHEWSHHVQTVLGFERTTRPETWNQVHSIELELMADCFSGAWARDAYERGRIDISDVDEAMNFTIQRLGDPTYIDEYDPQAHGTADQRVTAFMNGFEEGFSGCNIKI